MAVATSVTRYNKNQKILIDNEEISLIQHIQDLRANRKITKKKISNMIKQNDYWYSQIERDGKKGDDNRQKTIYRPDLIDIISIVKFGANSIADLRAYNTQSALYLDKQLKAIPLNGSKRKLEWYNLDNIRTLEEQDSLFSSLIASITKQLNAAYLSLSDREDKNNFLNSLKNMNASLKIDPLFIVFLSGLPISEFLYESDEQNITALIHDLYQSIDTFTKESEGTSNLDYLDKMRKIIQEYAGESPYLKRKKYEVLPPDEIEF